MKKEIKKLRGYFKRKWDFSVLSTLMKREDWRRISLMCSLSIIDNIMLLTTLCYSHVSTCPSGKILLHSMELFTVCFKLKIAIPGLKMVSQRTPRISIWSQVRSPYPILFYNLRSDRFFYECRITFLRMSDPFFLRI